MPNPNKREEHYIVGAQDAVSRAQRDQREAEHAGDDPKARTEARARKYARDTRAAVRRSQQ